MLDSTNMNEPINEDADPYSNDKSEIVMGYTQERPSPAAQALTITPLSP